MTAPFIIAGMFQVGLLVFLLVAGTWTYRRFRLPSIPWLLSYVLLGALLGLPAAHADTARLRRAGADLRARRSSQAPVSGVQQLHRSAVFPPLQRCARREGQAGWRRGARIPIDGTPLTRFKRTTTAHACAKVARDGS